MLKQLDNWHKTRKGYLIFGLIELLLAYIVASRAIETGSLWQYFFAFILLFGGLRNGFECIRYHDRHNKRQSDKA